MSEYNIQMNKYNALNAEYDQLYPATKIENVDGLDTALQKKADKDRLVNPNLLDNWYFGNPVDQRGGYVVPPDTPYYSDTGLSTQVSTVSAYTKATKVNGTYGTITVDSTTYYVAWSAAVRGYVGVGYMVDRWKNTNPGVVLLKSDGIEIVVIDNEFYFHQDIENNLLGQMATFSIITDNDVFMVTKGTTTDLHDKVTTIHDVGWIGFRANPDGTTSAFVTIRAGKRLKVKAVKLELGSQQTLAHQDADGNWILNEIPDYGEQLRRCQRYFVNFNPYKMPWFAMPPAVTGAVSTTEAKAFSTVSLPVAMRAEPVVSYGGTIFLSQTGNVRVTDVQISSSTFAGNYLQLIYITAGGLTENSLYRVQGGYDASAYIWLSADL